MDTGFRTRLGARRGVSPMYDTDHDKALADQMCDSRPKTLPQSLALLIRGGLALGRAANEILRLRGQLARLQHDHDWLTGKVNHGCTGILCERCDRAMSASYATKYDLIGKCDLPEPITVEDGEEFQIKLDVTA